MVGLSRAMGGYIQIFSWKIRWNRCGFFFLLALTVVMLFFSPFATMTRISSDVFWQGRRDVFLHRNNFNFES